MSCSARLPAIAAAATAMLALAGCGGGAIGADTPASSGQSFVGSSYSSTVFRAGARPTAPDISGTTLTGQHLSLSADRGSVVVINFWGSWCAPCRKEAADLQSVHAATENAGVKFVGVNIRDEQDPANAYDQAHDITYPSIFDPSGRVALQFAQVPPSAIPSTLVIDSTGHIAAIHLGSTTAKQLTDMITAAS